MLESLTETPRYYSSDLRARFSKSWKVNVSLSEDEEYIKDITEKIPIWINEGQNELSDNQSIWDWIKYKVRTHAIQHSKRRAKERNEIENILENEYDRAKKDF